MDREQRFPVVEHRDGIQLVRGNQRAAQRLAALVGEQAGRHNQTEPATRACQLQRALDEQLELVGVASPLPKIHTRVAREPYQRVTFVGRGCIAPQVGAQHLPRRVADDGVEAAVWPRPALAVEKHLRELQRPVKAPHAPRTQGQPLARLVHGPRRDCRPSQQSIEQRVIEPPFRSSWHPPDTPQVTRRLPPSEPWVVGQAGQRGLLATDDVGRVVGGRLDALPPITNRHQLARPLEQGLERQRRRRAARGRRTRKDIERRGADQAVARHQVMVQKRERAVGRKRREPDGQLRQLDGHRVAVHAEQASACNQAACGGPIGVGEVPVSGVTALDERPLPLAGKEAAD